LAQFVTLNAPFLLAPEECADAPSLFAKRRVAPAQTKGHRLATENRRRLVRPQVDVSVGPLAAAVWDAMGFT